MPILLVEMAQDEDIDPRHVEADVDHGMYVKWKKKKKNCFGKNQVTFW